MAVFSVLVLLGPLMLLGNAVVALSSYGPLGWLAAVLLVLAVVAATRWCLRLTLRWWRSTKAPVRSTARPAQVRSAPR